MTLDLLNLIKKTVEKEQRDARPIYFSQSEISSAPFDPNCDYGENIAIRQQRDTTKMKPAIRQAVRVIHYKARRTLPPETTFYIFVEPSNDFGRHLVLGWRYFRDTENIDFNNSYGGILIETTTGKGERT